MSAAGNSTASSSSAFGIEADGPSGFSAPAEAPLRSSGQMSTLPYGFKRPILPILQQRQKKSAHKTSLPQKFAASAKPATPYENERAMLQSRRKKSAQNLSAQSRTHSKMTPLVSIPKYFEYDNILAHRVSIEGRIEYLIKWKGYSSEHNSWEPLEHLKQAAQAIEKYYASGNSKLAR